MFIRGRADVGPRADPCEATKSVVTVRDDVCREIARWGEPYNPFKPPANTSPRDQRDPTGEGQGDVTAQAEPRQQDRVQQNGLATNGSVVARSQRAMGTFPESPPHATTSYMTTPSIPTRL